jgi:hypothetical protein
MVRDARRFQRIVIRLSLAARFAGVVVLVAVVVAGAGCGDSAPAGARPGGDGGVDTKPGTDTTPGAEPARDGAVLLEVSGALDAGSAPADAGFARPDVPLPVADAAPSACLTGMAVPTLLPALPQVSPIVAVPQPPSSVYLGDPTRLEAMELVQRMARFLWQEEPDAALLALAMRCGRFTLADVRALARQMLADARATRVVRAFVDDWLRLDDLANLERDPAAFPPITPSLRRSLAEEPRIFATQLILTDGGTLRQLLTAPHSFVNDDVARLYGAPLLDDSFRRVTFAAEEQRAGIFTQPGVLAAMGGQHRHSPPSRAAYLMERVLCRPVPPPPDGLDESVPPLVPGQSLRMAIEGRLAQQPVCAACHSLMHLGFAFEPFDALGRRRTMDNGAPINAQARVVGLDSGEIEVNGPVDLMTRLAEQPDSSLCFVRRWLELGLQRPLNSNDETVWRGLHDASTRDFLDIKSLIVEVTVTSAFLARGTLLP